MVFAVVSMFFMISGEHWKVRQKAVRWPCGVCSKGVGSNSLEDAMDRSKWRNLIVDVR